MNTAKSVAAISHLSKLSKIGRKLLLAISSHLKEERFAEAFHLTSETEDASKFTFFSMPIFIRVELVVGGDKGFVVAYTEHPHPRTEALVAAAFDELGNVALDPSGYAVTVEEAPPHFLQKLLGTLQKDAVPVGPLREVE